jgi:hypothetical protein
MKTTKAQLQAKITFQWTASIDQMWAAGEAFEILNRVGDLEVTRIAEVRREALNPVRTAEEDDA